MNKAYSRIGWENEPSAKTPLNETNMNLMDAGINELDNRIITLDTTKATKLEISTLFSDILWDENTGVLTLVRLNGSSIKIDTKLEKMAVNFVYDETNERLVLTLIDGTTQYIDLKALITQYDFLDSDTISLTVTDGKVQAHIKRGSITGDMLQPNYLADITVQAESANASAIAARQHAEAAAGSESTAMESALASSLSADNAAASALEALSSETNAQLSEAAAKEYMERASAHEIEAMNYSSSAQESANNASSSEVNAEASAERANESAEYASTYLTEVQNAATQASDSERLAQTYASAAQDCATQCSSNRDESKMYAEAAQSANEEIARKMQLAEFDIDKDGNLIYTDNSVYAFSVDDNGNLNWEVE